jgi:hypothetical protein
VDGAQDAPPGFIMQNRGEDLPGAVRQGATQLDATATLGYGVEPEPGEDADEFFT